MDHTEDQAAALRHAETLIRAGFLSDADILDIVRSWIGEAEPAVLAELETEVRLRIERQAEEEASWAGLTTNDLIDLAFEELTREGILALQDAGASAGDGWSEVEERIHALPRDQWPRGATFFHDQDVERALAGEGLLLAFSATEEGQSAEIAREICAKLNWRGVAARWSGDIADRIEILPFTWRKRRAV